MTQQTEFGKHLKLVNEMNAEEMADAIDYAIIETAALGLLKRWFPKNVPSDIEKWSEIAYEDVSAVLTALKEEGFQITYERTKDK